MYAGEEEIKPVDTSQKRAGGCRWRSLSRTPTMSPLDRLPVELLLHILKLCDKPATVVAAAQSHQRWCKIYYNSKDIVDRRVFVNYIGRRVAAAALCGIRIHASMSTFRDPEPGEPSFVEIVRERFNEASILDEDITAAEFSILRERVRVCRKLEDIYLHRCVCALSKPKSDPFSSS